MTAPSVAPESFARACPSCGARVATRFCTACGADPAGARLPLVHASAEAVALMRRLSLGAAGAPGIWTFAHGAPVLGILYWLFWLPLPPVSLGIAIYLLINGNRVALQRRRYRDAAEFRETERLWAIAGGVLLVPTLFATLVWSFLILAVLLGAGTM